MPSPDRSSGERIGDAMVYRLGRTGILNAPFTLHVHDDGGVTLEDERDPRTRLSFIREDWDQIVALLMRQTP